MGNVFFHEQGVTRSLITGYTASGAKSARMFHRRLYGTREIVVALQNVKQEAVMHGWHETTVAD